MDIKLSEKIVNGDGSVEWILTFKVGKIVNSIVVTKEDLDMAKKKIEKFVRDIELGKK
jgi:uncharacterized membrane protein (DUF485 family)